MLSDFVRKCWQLRPLNFSTNLNANPFVFDYLKLNHENEFDVTSSFCTKKKKKEIFFFALPTSKTS